LGAACPQAGQKLAVSSISWPQCGQWGMVLPFSDD